MALLFAGCVDRPPVGTIEVLADGYRYSGETFVSLDALAPALADGEIQIMAAECGDAVERRMVALMDYLQERGDRSVLIGSSVDCSGR